MKKDLLEKPFPNSVIKSRRGSFGKSLSYVEGSEYIRRLNDAFDSAWSFEIVEHQTIGKEMLVLGKLTAGDMVKMAFGGSTITTNRDTGELVSQVDDLKSAATDALKKACSLLGIGLHLYSVPASSKKETPQPETIRGRARRDSTKKPNQPPPRLTQKQLSAIWSYGRSLGMTADQIRNRCQRAFSVFPEFLSKSDASSFISELNEESQEARR